MQRSHIGHFCSLRGQSWVGWGSESVGALALQVVVWEGMLPPGLMTRRGRRSVHSCAVLLLTRVGGWFGGIRFMTCSCLPLRFQYQVLMGCDVGLHAQRHIAHTLLGHGLVHRGGRSVPRNQEGEEVHRIADCTAAVKYRLCVCLPLLRSGLVLCKVGIADLDQNHLYLWDGPTETCTRQTPHLARHTSLDSTWDPMGITPDVRSRQYTCKAHVHIILCDRHKGQSLARPAALAAPPIVFQWLLHKGGRTFQTTTNTMTLTLSPRASATASAPLNP